jgi:HK97 family phage prohead protease
MKIEHLSPCRELKFVASDDETKTGVFSGYGAVFGNLDSYGDVIAPGAFKETLRNWKRKGRLPPMLLQHGGGLFGGAAEDGIPVGVFTSMSEDDVGLKVDGELIAMSTDKGQYIYEGLKSGALDGLSIGYVAREVAYGKKPEEPKRTLKKVDLFEVSIVTFPANDAARVGGVKAINDLSTLADCEAWLRDAAGLSRAQALAFVARVKGLQPSDSGRSSDGDAALAQHLLNHLSTLRGR